MQLKLQQLQLQNAKLPDKTDSDTERAIESDDFPFEYLSRIAERESWRKEVYRPIYHVHKWWARRLGTVFRGIVLGALTPKGTNVIELFYSSARFPSSVIFDPFMGSGTTLGETLKLGGRAIGRDINPVSYLQVRTALTLRDSIELQRVYREIEADVADRIRLYYTSLMGDGTSISVLYYFWVMQVPCPFCVTPVDLFSNFIFAKHAYPRRNPTVQVICPKCCGITPADHRVRSMTCSHCDERFDARVGPVKGKQAKCPYCTRRFSIGSTIRETGAPPKYRMYAKLVLTPEGDKEYHQITKFDEALYDQAVTDLESSPCRIPQDNIKPGHNTNQVLNYGIRSWRHMFNARQLLCISTLAERIGEIDDPTIRDTFTCLFSGVLEFNNMFASYKGEGTGAVRHMYNHHILKPERTPLEANIWGTPKSSGAFSTLFQTRLLRAARYAKQPFELALLPPEMGNRSHKVYDINKPLVGLTNSESYCQFKNNSRLYISCGDSAVTDLADECVDLVITDPPFFDNVHYSQLADFFYAWQRLILEDYPSHQASTTRSQSEVQNSDARKFTHQLTLVFRESARVLKRDGLLVFTYHHSRWEGWLNVLQAVMESGFQIQTCYPIKSEMAVAKPKHQAKEPINFDVIMVCRFRKSEVARIHAAEILDLSGALERAETQVRKLLSHDWQLSRNDIGVVFMAQVIAELSRLYTKNDIEEIMEQIEGEMTKAIDLFDSSELT